MNDLKVKRSVVPWKNPDQFIKVYECAYSDDIARKRWAVDQMAIWETRCWPSLPTAVEATDLLVRSKIQDMLFEAHKSLCQAREIEMMYSTSIIRFVNLILENDQNTKGKIRMSQLAEKRNIPAWIIDVRHNITHGHSPTLPVFRMAYETIMEYLEEIFWLPESSLVRSIKKTFDESTLLESFQEYKAVQMQEILNKYDRKESYQQSHKAVLKKMESFLSKLEQQRKFIEILVHPDHFVTKEDVNALVSYDNAFIEFPIEDLPLWAQKLWIPVIELLHEYDCVPTFLELLLLSQKNRRIKIFQKIADALVLFILDLIIPKKDDKKKESNKWGQHIFSKKGDLMDWPRLLYSCVIGASDFSHFVFKRITSVLKMNSWIEELAILLTIKQGRTIERDLGIGTKRKLDITFTADDLEEELQARMEKINVKLKKNRFSLTPASIDFSNLPLGHVFNPVEYKPKKEIIKETESISVEEKESLYEGSKPIEVYKPKSFLFKELPTDTSMIYRGSNIRYRSNNS